MQLKEQLEKDLSQALLKRDALFVSVLRMLKAKWQNLGIELRAKGKELSEEDILKLLKKAIKQRKESIALFIQGKRQDLADKEKKELEILKRYLPEELSEEVLIAKIKELIEEADGSIKDNFGLLMKSAMQKLENKVEGSRVSKIIKDLIS